MREIIQRQEIEASLLYFPALIASQFAQGRSAVRRIQMSN
jgi:hypothetical protein